MARSKLVEAGPIDDLGDDEVFRGGAAFSFPVGDMFGIQADLTALNAMANRVGRGPHAFTRDPNPISSALTAATSMPVRPISGMSAPKLNFTSTISRSKRWAGSWISAMVSAPSSMQWAKWLSMRQKLRLSIGASTVANFETANAGLEWFMGDTGLPVSLTVDGELGEDGYTSIQAGLSLYFGGEDKSLIRRHREDDPGSTSSASSMQGFWVP